jgi:hypothetical protein
MIEYPFRSTKINSENLVLTKSIINGTVMIYVSLGSFKEPLAYVYYYYYYYC